MAIFKFLNNGRWHLGFLKFSCVDGVRSGSTNILPNFVAVA